MALPKLDDRQPQHRVGTRRCRHHDLELTAADCATRNAANQRIAAPVHAKVGKNAPKDRWRGADVDMRVDLLHRRSMAPLRPGWAQGHRRRQSRDRDAVPGISSPCEKIYIVRQRARKQVLYVGLRKSFVFPPVLFGPLQLIAAAHLRFPRFTFLDR